MIRTASRQHCQAFGCGPKITALRVLMAMMHLNSTVDVGFVIGREREDDADRFRHLHQAALRKLANHADGALVPDVVVDKLRGHHVLDGLVLQHPEPGFLNRQGARYWACSSPARTIGLTMRSTSSWVYWVKTAAAVLA